MTALVPPGPHADQRHTSPHTRYEWQVTAVADDGGRAADVRGICRRYTCATRHVEAELAGAPGGAEAYGTVRGLTVTFALAAADGAYQRWDRQAVAVRAADGAVTWFRDRVVDAPAESAGVGG